MKYRDLALSLAQEAGKIMKESFVTGMKRSIKSDNTPVTEADIKINTLVINSIRKNFPTHSIIAEEGSDLRESEYVWICDPIDGTLPFSHGLPTCAFSLALVKNGEPILGVISDPFMNRTIIAEKGKGSFMNGKKISVSKEHSLNGMVIGMNGNSQIKIGALEIETLGVAKELVKRHTKVISLYSTVYPAMLVAVGEFVAMLGRGVHPWDYAAIKIIVEEAGGKVTNIEGKEQRYDQDVVGCILTNGLVHQELLDILKDNTK